MRTLVVTDEYPWPPRSGYRQRLDAVLRILSKDADIELLAVVLGDRGLAPPEAPLARHTAVVAGRRPESRMRRRARWLSGTDPRALLWRDWSAPRALLREWAARTRYDVVWFSHAPAYLALRDLVDAPHIVDLDNLESSALSHRRGAGARVGAIADRLDAGRWRSLEHEITRSAAAVVVCSELDRARLDAPTVRIVRNGYELAPSGTERIPRPEGPVLLMVGLLTYEANRDGARWLAEQVLPLVRDAVPGAGFRLVGRVDRPEHVAAIGTVAGVTMVGEVDDIGRELVSADVSVVPIRFGGGTRIKILEAFAHRLPVVTTTVGAEGLDVVDGEHLLLADTAASFAAACLRLCQDAPLRTHLVRAAYRLWYEHYRWSVIAPDVSAVVDAVVRDG